MPYGHVKDAVTGEWRKMTDEELKEHYGGVERPPRRKRTFTPEAEEPKPNNFSFATLPQEIKIPLAMLPVTLADLLCVVVTDMAGMEPPLSFAMSITQKDIDTVLAGFDVYASSLNLPLSPLQTYLTACGTVAGGAIFAAFRLRDIEKKETKKEERKRNNEPIEGEVVRPAEWQNSAERSKTIPESNLGPVASEGDTTVNPAS